MKHHFSKHHSDSSGRNNPFKRKFHSGKKSAGQGQGSGRSKAKGKPGLKSQRNAEAIFQFPARLNKYLAHAGVASRREADALIEQGEVTVNGQTVREMGYKVQENDVVKFQNRIIRPEKKVYILLNKPKDYITTTDDEKDRKTVMDLIGSATSLRVYPVGRLDRKTTGLLLLTNDGELTQKLTHPKHEVKKVYLAVLDKPLKLEDMQQIAAGIPLEEGIARVDAIEYADRQNKSHIGIELHIGWNKVVRRIFEQLGYQVMNLDRMYYGGLTKKDLPRGKWRYLSDKEVIMLKHFA